MNSLVGNYGGDSGSEDDDHEHEKRSAQVKKPASNSKSDWTTCMDSNTGYPYYWNTKTNEVRWEKPGELKDRSPPSVPKVFEPRKSAQSFASVTNDQGSKKRAKTTFIGPSLPPVKPEDVAMQKIKKFEENLANSLIAGIEKETPPDWTKQGHPRPIYSRPFAWKKKEPVQKSVQILEKEFEPSTNPIALIAGYNSEDEESEEESKGSKRKLVHVKVKSSSKRMKTALKPSHSIFQSNEASDDEGDIAVVKEKPKKSKGFDLSGGPSYKKSIDQVAELLCDKLESLDVNSMEISPLKILAVQVETIFDAWQSGALSAGYMQKFLSNVSSRMSTIESEELAPPGWRAVWNRSRKRYDYEHKETGEVKKDCPVAEKVEVNGNSTETQPPPLPPADAPLPVPPPPPPQVETKPPPPPPPPPEEVSQVEDMDIEDDEDGQPSIQTIDGEKPADDLSDALDTFYSDLAEMDSNSQHSIPNPPSHSPSPIPNDQQIAALQDDGSNSPKTDGFGDEYRKKKKGTKLASGILMKKKDVGHLVAKWQNLQQGARP